MQGVANRVRMAIVDQLEVWAAQQSLIGDSVFFSKEQFPWANDLEANWKTIRQELDQVMQDVDILPNFQDISLRQSNITSDDRWKTYFFYAFGFRAEKNCQRCPKTTKLLENIPGLKVAFFSILAPHKHIPEHRGKYKGVIRYHLALKVPQPSSACRIRIADQTAHWEEGKSLIFDDTFPHEVWNDTDDYRAVLFLDIERPLKFPMSFVNWLVSQLLTTSSVIQSAKTNHAAWETYFEQQKQEIAVK
jgi:beta-hydroxylase